MWNLEFYCEARGVRGVTATEIHGITHEQALREGGLSMKFTKRSRLCLLRFRLSSDYNRV